MKTTLLLLFLCCSLTLSAQTTKKPVKKKATTSKIPVKKGASQKNTSTAAAKKAAVRPLKFFNGTQNQFENLLRDSSKPGIIYVMTASGWPSQRFEKNVLQDPSIVNLIDSNYYIFKVDAGESPDIVFQNELEDLPTLLLLDRNGRVTDKLQGYTEPDKVKKFLKSGL